MEQDSTWVRSVILGQATIAALETPDPSDARKRGTAPAKKHETHPFDSEITSGRCSACLPKAPPKQAIRLFEAVQSKYCQAILQTPCDRREAGD